MIKPLNTKQDINLEKILSAQAYYTLQNHYLDFVNNYLTVEKFAEHNEITLDQAQRLLTLGKEVHETIVAIHRGK